MKHFSVGHNTKKAAAFALSGLAIALAATASYADDTDTYVNAQMSKLHIPGMAVAVLRDGKVIKETSYGVASAEFGVPVTVDTPFVLASMTKLFTASSIMLLVQEGKITLDEPITKVLPELPAKWSNVTIRHCLSHTSGLPDAITDDINVTVKTGDRNELFKILANETAKTPGSEVAYNQTGYAILGMIIEKISGLPYQQFVQQRLFDPAGLKHASFGDAWKIIPGRVSMYTALDITADHTKLAVKDGRPVMLDNQILHYGSKYMPDYLAPAGLSNASLHDLVNWEKAMASGSIVTQNNLQIMATPFKMNDGSDGNFGLSFLPMKLGSLNTVSYGGGAATWRVSVPEKHITVIVLTNLQGCRPENLAIGIAALYEPEIAANLDK
jgi:CubicO group peptidase (beta-lactamase class C family)